MIYHYQLGLIRPFFQRHFKLIVLAIAGLFVFSQISLMLQPAKADSDPVITEIRAEIVNAPGFYTGIAVTPKFDNLADVLSNYQVKVSVNRNSGDKVSKNSRAGVAVIAQQTDGTFATTAPIIIEDGSYGEDDSGSWHPAPAVWSANTAPTSVEVVLLHNGAEVDSSSTTTFVGDAWENIIPGAVYRLGTVEGKTGAEEYFDTIQEAIDDDDGMVNGFSKADAVGDGSTDAGDIIEVGDGIFAPFSTHFGGDADITIRAAAGASPIIEGSSAPASRLVDLRADGTTFSGFTVRSAVSGVNVGISMSGKSLNVNNNVIENTLTGIQTTTHYDTGTSVINNNTISAEYGISLQNDSNHVFNNEITSTVEGFGVIGEQNEIEYNNINAVSGNNAVAYGGVELNVTKNWWGSQFQPTGMVNDVVYDPWLCQPWQDGDSTSLDGSCIEPDTTPPAIPTGLHRVAKDDGEVMGCSNVTQRQILYPTWDANTELDFSHYEYTSYNAGGTIGLNEAVVHTNQFIHSWTPPVDGTNGFKVRAVDTNGNKSDFTPICHVTYDSTAPIVEITNPGSDGGLFNNNVEVLGSVHDANLRHYWVQVKKNGSVVFSKTTLESTSFTDRLIYTATEDGEYEVTLAARDTAGGGSDTGNRSGDVVRMFTIDKTPPEAPTLISPSNNSVITGDNLTNDWDDVSDAASYIYQSYNVDSSGVCKLLPPRFTATYSDSNTNTRDVSDLTFCWRVKAVDAAGNESGWSELWKVTVDNTPPEKVQGLTIINEGNVLGCNALINSRTITVDWDDSNEAGVRYEYHNKDKSLFDDLTVSEFTGAIRDQDGFYQYKVRAIDKAGNVGEWSDWCGVTLDREPPQTIDPLTSPVGVVSSPVTISGTTTDLNGVDFVDLYYAEAGTGSYTHITTLDNTSNDSPFSWTFDWTPPSEGTYDIKAAGTDVAGNQESSGYALAVVVDLTAPVVTVNNLTTDDTTPELTGTVDDSNATMEIIVNGITYSAVNNGDGTWTLPNDTINPALLVAVYDVQATATDSANNSGSDNTSDELRIVAQLGVSDKPNPTGTNRPNNNTSTNGDGGHVLAASGNSIWLGSLLGSVIIALALMSNRIKFATVEARIKKFRTSK